ncbi:MAG: preprotein translocase subunit SecG [Deltaproteobacteria bacterium SG8_13]|nr:MAG: preprotein translocase subunit SecG [Deltaproteobacteria bacterium SG8_13]
MSQVLIIIHLVVCVALIMIVLLQTGKGADMGAAFGGGASQTLFGSTGASTFLSKLTTVAAIIFMVTSLALAYYSTRKTQGSIMIDSKPPIEEQAQPQTGDALPSQSQTQEATTESLPAPAKSE